MARQLEFDRSEALARAVDAFWQDGYESMPVLDLAQAMGVAKSSLYNTFGSKKTVLLESLDHYADSQRSKVLALARSENVVARLRHLLLEAAADNNAGRGCLLVNTAAEFGSRDAQVRQHVKAGFDGMQDAFAALIRAGQASGDIPAGVQPQQYAVILVTGVAGLRVLAKGGLSEVDLLPVVENLLAGLSA